VSHHCDTIEVKDVQQIDRIPSKGDPASVAPRSGRANRVAPDPRSAGTIVRQPR